MAKTQTSKYQWESDDFVVSKKVDLPTNLIPVVENAPENDDAIAQYLQNLLENEDITFDEVNFLIDCEVLAVEPTSLKHNRPGDHPKRGGADTVTLDKEYSEPE